MYRDMQETIIFSEVQDACFVRSVYLGIGDGEFQR